MVVYSKSEELEARSVNVDPGPWMRGDLMALDCKGEEDIDTGVKKQSREFQQH